MTIRWRRRDHPEQWGQDLVPPKLLLHSGSATDNDRPTQNELMSNEKSAYQTSHDCRQDKRERLHKHDRLRKRNCLNYEQK
jgi:hypothetical protein